MSTDNRFSSRKITEQPLPAYKDHEKFKAEPARLIKPLIECLEEIHQAGQSHGAVTPCRIHISPAGEINLDFFRACAGAPDSTETLTYYPEGLGDSLETCQRRDAQALGAVLHLIIIGHPPATPQRGRQKLAENPCASGWPAAFIEMVDRLLAVDGHAVLPTLLDVAMSLEEGLESASEPPAAIVAEAPRVEAPTVEIPPRPADVVRTVPSIRLPNGMVGRAFDADIAPAFVGALANPGRIEMAGEIPAGLAFKDDRLTGTPELAGEFDIAFRLEAEQCTVSLMINPDPRSLWKNTPSDQSGEFWKPDADSSFLADAPLTVLGASQRGRSHAHVGSFRDDDMSMAWYPADSWTSLTVADGAGSAKYSRRGSMIACETMKTRFGEYFASGENPLSKLLADPAVDTGAAVRNELYQLFGQTALEARKAIDAQAAAVNATLRDFHTTLVTALLHPLPDGRWFVATFSIGDGAAAVVAVPGGDPCLLTRPDGGEYAGQTVFLTMTEALATGEAIMGRIRMAIIPGFEALILVTDGISDPRFESEAALADPAAWALLWNELRMETQSATTREAAAAAILKWMDFHSAGHHDDRTLIVATPSSILSTP